MCFERSTAREALTYFWNCQTLGVSPAEPGAYQGLVIALLYDAASYLIFFVTFLYAIGFVGNVFVPRSIDVQPREPGAFVQSVLINAALLLLFAVQHTIMARPAFKQWWTRIIPRSVERSTFVLLASLILILLFWQWRPLTGQIWSVEHAGSRLALTALFWIGWLTVLLSTFMIGHFDLFRLNQVYKNLRQEEIPKPEFKTPGLYKLIRHPIMLGFIIAFWATPDMTVGHLIFSVATTGYILIGIWFEEKDLIDFFGDTYRQYKRDTGMLIPLPKGGKAEEPAPDA